MTDADVIAAIQRTHLKANIDRFEREPCSSCCCCSSRAPCSTKCDDMSAEASARLRAVVEPVEQLEARWVSEAVQRHPRDLVRQTLARCAAELRTERFLLEAALGAVPGQEKEQEEDTRIGKAGRSEG